MFQNVRRRITLLETVSYLRTQHLGRFGETFEADWLQLFYLGELVHVY